MAFLVGKQNLQAPLNLPRTWWAYDGTTGNTWSFPLLLDSLLPFGDILHFLYPPTWHFHLRLSLCKPMGKKRRRLCGPCPGAHQSPGDGSVSKTSPSGNGIIGINLFYKYSLCTYNTPGPSNTAVMNHRRQILCLDTSSGCVQLHLLTLQVSVEMPLLHPPYSNVIKFLWSSALCFVQYSPLLLLLVQ